MGIELMDHIIVGGASGRCIVSGKSEERCFWKEKMSWSGDYGTI